MSQLQPLSPRPEFAAIDALNLEELGQTAGTVYQGDQVFSASFRADGTVVVRGNAVMLGEAVINGSLVVLGSLTVQGSLEQSATGRFGIVATGDITLSGRTRIRLASGDASPAIGIATLQGNLRIDGDADIEGMLYAPASAEGRGTVTLHGSVRVHPWIAGNLADTFCRVEYIQ